MSAEEKQYDKIEKVYLKENEQYFVYKLKIATDYGEFGTKEIRHYNSKGLIL